MIGRKVIIGVIPVRYGSTRLPGKPLLDICGKPMVQRVYELASRSSLLDEVIVATDDQRVFDAVQSFGGKVMLTSVEHTTGSDRIAEVVRKMDCDFVVNIQGDEPLILPEIIDEVINALVTDRKQVMATCCHPIIDDERLHNTNVVKVVSDINGNAMLFSRAQIPFPRNPEFYVPYEHIGIFAFRKDFLLKYVGLPNTPLSLTESLEQLKAMENGYPIKVVKTKYAYTPPSVKTQEDLEVVRMLIGSKIPD